MTCVRVCVRNYTIAIATTADGTDGKAQPLLTRPAGVSMLARIACVQTKANFIDRSISVDDH